MKRTFRYGMPKHELVRRLYELQHNHCPLCKQSIHTDMRRWVAWREKTKFEGRMLRRKDVNLNIDHIVAVADGGSDDVDNLALTHRRCNDIRGTIMVYDERPHRDDSAMR